MSDDDDNMVRAWTDGSANSEGGGWSFYVLYHDKCATRYGWAGQTTMNVMELTAILRVLQFVRPTPQPLIIYTDSKYARSCLLEWVFIWRQRGWMTSIGDSVKNKDLIEDILKLLEVHRKVRKVEIKWLRGHAGHFNNERCDHLARTAREQKQTNWTLPEPVVESSNVIEQ